MALKRTSAGPRVRIHRRLRTDTRPPSVPGLGYSSRHSPRAIRGVHFSSVPIAQILQKVTAWSEETHLFVGLVGFF